MACTLCIGAMPEGEWCRACGEGLPTEPGPPIGTRLFDRRLCGHPPDPIAIPSRDGEHWWCHCGWGLDPKDGRPIEGAPGPVVNCAKCGCHVAIPSAPFDDAASERPAPIAPVEREQ